MIIHVPNSLRALEPMLAEFFDGMVFKLHVNSHKKGLEEQDIPGFVELMKKELMEFEEQILTDRTDTNSLMEACDASNFWFLIFAFLRQEGVATQREKFLDEYFRIDPDNGKVFCVKKRSGSKYGPGDEITGTVNSKGEVTIRTQNAAGGFAVTLPRSHLVWWKSTGAWPAGILGHLNHDPKDDRFRNLISNSLDEENAARYPFVSQYCPTGREGTPNYGKWVYQRRHMFRLVRCGYWATQAEAAEQGLIAWKAKIAEIREDANA